MRMYKRGNRPFPLNLAAKWALSQHLLPRKKAIWCQRHERTERWGRHMPGEEGIVAHDMSAALEKKDMINKISANGTSPPGSGVCNMCTIVSMPHWCFCMIQID